MELLKKRIDSAAETIANGVQPRSKAEALNQCVYLYPFVLFISSFLREKPPILNTHTPFFLVSQDLYFPAVRFRIFCGREPRHRTERGG